MWPAFRFRHFGISVIYLVTVQVVQWKASLLESRGYRSIARHRYIRSASLVKYQLRAAPAVGGGRHLTAERGRCVQG